MDFCEDSQLSYDKSRTEFTDGRGLNFDDAYRLAHLPLVAPDHPLVIPSKPGTGYSHGVHELVFSMAMPIFADELFLSKPFIALYEEIYASKFAHKLSWDVFSRGLFSGNINIGRLYLKVYPEQRNGKNMCHVIQSILGSRMTDLYVVGLFNFIEELNCSEAQDLREILDRWWDVDIVDLRLENLWLMKSKDDLVLNGSIDQHIRLI